jgi:hypothetical protein
MGVSILYSKTSRYGRYFAELSLYKINVTKHTMYIKVQLHDHAIHYIYVDPDNTNHAVMYYHAIHYIYVDPDNTNHAVMYYHAIHYIYVDPDNTNHLVLPLIEIPDGVNILK